MRIELNQATPMAEKKTITFKKTTRPESGVGNFKPSRAARKIINKAMSVKTSFLVLIILLLNFECTDFELF